MEAGGIPPPVISSALNSVQSQRQATDASRIDEVRQAHAQRTQSARDEEMDMTVETTDADMQVNTDGGGLGSQGRAFESEGEEEPTEDAETTGITRGEDGRLHIDMEA